MPAPSKVKFLLIHTSDSSWGDVSVIRKWHTDPPPQGRGWSDIGYHFVCLNGFSTYGAMATNKRDSKLDGKVVSGRPEHLDGAHCVGYNSNSVALCMVGRGGRYTKKQLDALKEWCLAKMKQYNIPVQNVLGHYETPNGKQGGKTCPDINMVEFRAELTRASQQLN